MDPSLVFPSFILLIINVIGARRIGTWDGSKIKKYIYRFTLFVLAFFAVFYTASLTKNHYMFRYPLFYLMQYTIISHLLIKRSAKIWIEMGLLPFSSNYPKKVKKDWVKMDFSEKYILGGFLLISSIGYSQTNIIMGYLRPIIFFAGVFFVGYGSYLKYSQPVYLIATILISIGIIITPIATLYGYNYIGLVSVWIGLLLVLLGYLNYKKKLSLPISLKVMILHIKDYFNDK